MPSRLNRRGLVAAAAGGLAALFGMSEPAAQTKGELINFPALQLLDGGRIEPGDWKGRSGVIVFWSIDCPYCKRHNARLEQLFQASRARRSDLMIVGIATDADPQLVRKHLAVQGWHFPVALATPGIRAAFPARRVVPMTILIDRQGRVKLAIPGEMTEDDLMLIGRELG